MEVVIGFMADSCREQDDWDVLGQLFVEPCKLVFVVGVKEVLSVVHTEEFGVTWIDDSFALEHCIEAPNDSSGKGTFPETLPILVDVSPTYCTMTDRIRKLKDSVPFPAAGRWRGCLVLPCLPLRDHRSRLHLGQEALSLLEQDGLRNVPVEYANGGGRCSTVVNTMACILCHAITEYFLPQTGQYSCSVSSFSP